jgi:hypothetical protein
MTQRGEGDYSKWQEVILWQDPEKGLHWWSTINFIGVDFFSNGLGLPNYRFKCFSLNFGLCPPCFLPCIIFLVINKFIGTAKH